MYVDPYDLPSAYHPKPYWDNYYYYSPSTKGWECPKCTRVYAPFMTECYACNGRGNTTSTFTTTCDSND